MKVTFQKQHSYFYNNSQQADSLGSSSFGSEKHSWKVCIPGNLTAGFAFGMGGIP